MNALDNAGINCLKDPEIQELLGSFERESEESSFLRKLRGEEDFSSSLSTSIGSEVTISRESSIFRDDLLFSRNETPGLTAEECNVLERSENERINLLVEKCNKSDLERYTLSFQEDPPPASACKLIDLETNYKNGNVALDDDQDLPVNLRRSTANRCMNEQVLRDEIASPVRKMNCKYGIFMDEERKNGLLKLFSANQDSSPSSSGKEYSSMSFTSQESSPGSSDVAPKTRGGHYRKTFEELERQRQEIAQALPIPGLDASFQQKREETREPFDVYLSESALEEFRTSPREWLRRTSLMSTPKGFGKTAATKSISQEQAKSAQTSPRVERPMNFSTKSRNGASADTIFVCYPNYSLPDMSFVQKIIGQTSPSLVLSPTKPEIGTQSTKTKTRPKSFGGYEKLSRENFSHIKDWDSLNVLLPDDLRRILDESPRTCAAPPPVLGGGVLRRNKNRSSRNNRFSLQEPLIATIGEEEDEEPRGCFSRSQAGPTGCCRQLPAPRRDYVYPSNHCCHHPAPPPPPVVPNHCHASHCCPSAVKESQMESLSKEKLNKLLSMSDALEEITSLLNMVTSMKANPCNSKTPSGAEGGRTNSKNVIKKPRPVSMTSCGFKSQIPVIKPSTAASRTAPKVPPRSKTASK